MRGLAYWYKPQTSSAYINVSKYVDEQAKGGEAINEIPGNFSFTLKAPLDQDSNYITVSAGDEFAITENETNTNLIIHGQVVDPGIDILGWNNLLNKPYFKFDVVCVQKDFSLSPIDSMNFTDTNLSVILDEIMSYTDNSLGSISLQKYRVNFEDYIIGSFSVEKKSSREALTDLVEQIDSFWSLKYLVQVDLVNTLFITRYIEISNKNGITPEISSIWEGGITTNSTKRGTVLNPIEANRFFMQNIAAEIEAKLKKDISVMCNFIELSAKIYSLGNSDSLVRYDFPAAPNKFDYDLDGYASDIVYVAFAIKDPATPVKILNGSTSTIIKITSRFATSIKIGDIAYFKDDSPNNFYPVISVNKISIAITEIGFNTLPFTPVENNSFEIVNNVEIFEEKYDLNYSQKGVVKYTNKDQVGKLKFLDLSEPPPGVFVTVFYKKIQDQKVILKNDESIRKIGLMYKEVKLDDDMIFTQEELNNLASKLLVLEPKLSFSIISRRYGLAPIGLSIPIIINGFINTNFILEKNEWQFVGIDPQGMPIFNNKLFFSNMINTPESYIKALKRRKATKSGVVLAKDIIKETLKLIETISFNLTGLLIPTALSASNITSTTFRANFLTTNTDRYWIYISNNIDFTTYTVEELVISVAPGTAVYEECTLPGGIIDNQFYYKIKAVLNFTEFSEFSNTITVNLAQILFEYKFQEGTGNSINDETSNNNDATIIGTADWQSGVISGDTSSLKLSGTSNYITTSNFSDPIVDFTIEQALIFETGDKTAKSFHDFFSKYDAYLNDADGLSLVLEYVPSTNDLYFLVFDDSHTIASPKYRYLIVNYNLLENVNYTIQASFILADAANSGLNSFELCINGVKQIGTIFNFGISNISAVNNKNNAFYIGATRGYDISFNYSQFKLMRTTFYTESRTEANALNYYNDLFTRDLVTDSYDLFYYRNQNGSGNAITDSLILNNGTISGTANWESGIISGDNYSLRLDGSTNYITTPLDSTNFINFTIRKTLRFETGDKTAKSFHPIIGKYDYYAFSGVNGWNFISEFVPSTNKIILYVFDDTSVLGNLKYRTYEVTYNLLENVDYILQIAFKLDDPSNSHLNTAEICINGVKISGSWTDYGISNITTIKNQTQEIKIGAERGTGSTHDVAKFKSLRSALSRRFRTETEALDDYNILFA